MNATAPAQPQTPTLTSTGQFATGAVATAPALFATQPAFFIKTVLQSTAASSASIVERVRRALIEQHFTQTNAPVPAHAPFKFPYIKGMWAGGCVCAFSGALAEAISFAVRGLGMRVLQPVDGALSPLQDLAATSAGGVFGAPVNNAAEKVMYEQIKNGSKFTAQVQTVLKTEGMRGLSKGTALCTVRDALYNLGVFPFYEAGKHFLEPTALDPLVRDTVAGMGAGMLAGGASFPFDFVKTRLQLDPSYPNARAAARAIFKQEGVRSFVDPRNILARAFTVGPLIGLTAIFKDRFAPYLPKSFYEQAKANQAAHF